MIGSHNDKGARCSKHGTEIFMPRCAACQSLNREYAALNIEGQIDAT